MCWAIAPMTGPSGSCSAAMRPGDQRFLVELTIATTQSLPMLFYIEDNGYGISAPRHFKRLAKTLPRILPASAASTFFDGDGTDHHGSD